jgi:acyl carrier protein
VTPVDSPSRDRFSSRDQVLHDVRQIIAEQLGMSVDSIQESAALEADLGCDSLDIVEITMEVEEQFDISVPDEYGERVRTVRDMVDGVLQLVGQTSASP